MNNSKPKEPLVAVMLSFILGGLGQIYAGRIKRGILFFSIPLLFGIPIFSYVFNPNTQLNAYLLIPFVLLIPFGIFVIIDAYRCAKAFNVSNGLNSNITAGKRVLIIIGILFFMFVRTLYIRANVVQAFKIPSGAMKQTILVGDRILADKFTYKNSEPKRGDIIIFPFPEDPSKNLVID